MSIRKLSDLDNQGNLKTYQSAENAKIRKLYLPKLGLVAGWQSDVELVSETTNTVTSIPAILDSSNTDLTGSNNAIQQTKISQPKLINFSLNNLPIIRFNGNNSFLKSNGNAHVAKMIIAVFRQNNFLDYNAIIAARSSSSAQKTLASNEDNGFEGVSGTFNIFSIGTSTAIYVNGIAKNINNYNNFNVGVPLPDNTNFHLVEHIQTSSTLGQKYWMIGTDPFGSGRYFNGDIAMIAIYNVDDDNTRLNVRAYAKQKYNLIL